MPAWASWIIARLAHFLIYAILGFALFAVIVKPVFWPTATTTQTGGVSYTLQPRHYFGCTNWNIKDAEKPAALLPATIKKGVAK